MRSKVLLIAGLLVLSVPAHAYVDPGTGSLAVQFLIGGAVALAFTIKTYYYAIRSKIRALLGRPDRVISVDSEDEGSVATDKKVD